MSESGIDVEAVRALAEIVRDTGATELEYDDGQHRIRVSREVTVAQPAAAPAPAAAAAAQPAAQPAAESAGEGGGEPDWHKHPGAVTSPMVGTAYLGPAPDKPPYVRVGDRVDEGQTVLIVEAMKVMNPIRAPRSGTVRHVAVSDGAPVEYGELLLVIE